MSYKNTIVIYMIMFSLMCPFLFYGSYKFFKIDIGLSISFLAVGLLTVFAVFVFNQYRKECK